MRADGGYDATFYDSLRQGALKSAQHVVPLVLSLTGARRVIDVGCGSGAWLSVFAEHGVEVLGVEGPHLPAESLDIASERVLRHDLTQPFALDERFDLAMSLEVAEHLPIEAAEDFVATLVRLSSLVLFSAAAPHQGGREHVNEQWPSWWAERFASHGYVPVDCIRRRIWSDPDVEWWYAQNTLLYVAGDVLAALPALQREHEQMGRSQLDVVHPTRYLEWVDYGITEAEARWTASDS